MYEPEKVHFKKAIPVWAENEEETLNYRLCIKTKTTSLSGCVAKIGANSFYKLYVNDKFVAFGPARTAGGYARVDEISLDEFSQSENEVVLFVAGYNNRALSTVKASSFVICEILNAEGKVVSSTPSDFVGFCDTRRVRKTERFSFQRHFSEVFDERNIPFSVCLVPSKNNPVFIKRVVDYPSYDITSVDKTDRIGRFYYDESLPCKEQRYSNPISVRWGKYDESEIEYLPYRWVQKQKMVNTCGAKQLPLRLNKGEYAVFDFTKINVGFLRYGLSANEDSEITLAFSEMRLEGEFHFQNANMHTVIHSVVPNGFNAITESFEPYSFRYVAVFVKEGSVEFSSLQVRAYEHTRNGLKDVEFKDKTLEKIYNAGVNTFLHNAVDLYTDCPSRERAGWLCDSYFTAKAEYFLFGQTKVEQAFLENYLLYKPNGEYPKGVLPMCYPSDDEDSGKFIPQWNMWLVLQITEYLLARNGKIPKSAFKDWVCEFMEFLAGYENEYGLLENLPSWNFVEWSSANDWTKDVNYPTNFLYAQVLLDAGALFGGEKWLEKAERVRKTTLEMAFDGEYFVDHAVRVDGVLKNLTDTSEAGQYYAILFGRISANEKKYEKLWEKVFNGFETPTDRNFVNVNAFIGFYLRLLTLGLQTRKDVLKRDVIGFFGHMEDLTGTLWEYKQHKGSYDHGFASLVCKYASIVDDE